MHEMNETGKPETNRAEDEMGGPDIDPITAESMQQDADFAEEHTKPTHADEHPEGEELESDESTPQGLSGMDS
ncbi:hypothetical protein [Nocardia miyunensis]|uniref:hypothetical protein n=1 Tax=Nocardia miyunensis TaxID=282684 RepID=UPI00083298EF|nr:hypothetical protein [Nocardia miyunensis]